MATTLNEQIPPPQVSDTRSVQEILKDHDAIQAALTRGYYRAVLRHRAGNVPMVNMRDGKIVEADPNTIEIPPEILARILATPDRK